LISLPELAAAAAILGVASTLQGAVGFGMGLFSIPLLVWSGFPLPQAVAMLVGASFAQTAYGTYREREWVNWRLTLPIAAMQWLFIPLGVLSMSYLVRADGDVVKQAIGLAVIVAVTARLLIRPEPRDEVGAGWAALAGSVSGFIGGLVGMGGPPLVFFALAHRWEKDRFRAFLWSQFFLATPVIVIALCFRFGLELLELFAIGLATAPVLVVGTRVGLAITHRWNAGRLSIAVVALLYVIGLSSVLGPYLAELAR